MTFAHLTHTISPSTVWDVRVGRFVFDRRDDPSTGSATMPSRFDRATGVFSGAPQAFGGLLLKRTTAKASLTHFRPRLLGAAHQRKTGVQLERGEHRFPTIVPTGTRYVDDDGAPFQSISRDPSNVGGVFVTAAAFASDAMTVGDALTLNLGLRFEHSRAVSQDVPTLDADGNDTDVLVSGLGTLYTWDVWSPRVGATLKLTWDGRTTMRASYGRFNQGVLTGELEPFHPAATATTTRAFDSLTGTYATIVSIVDPRTNLQLDRGMRAPRTDEYSIGVDQDIGRGVTATAAYVHKQGQNFIGWTDVAGVYRERLHPLRDGRSLPVLEIDDSTNSRRFLLTNPPEFSLSYNGLVIAAEKRHSSGWQVFGSYTFSRATGLQVSSGGIAAASQVSTIAGAPYLTFGQDPNSLTNARGRLPNDRPHMLRLMGSGKVPRTGLEVAANLQHLSGKPLAATTQVSLRQGDQRILVEPRGTRRLSSQTLLDLRVSRAFRVGGANRVELLLDVLNALNDTAEEGIATDKLFSSNFGRPTAFVDPRRAIIGVRLTLGR
jgi:TonB dependent receptor